MKSILHWLMMIAMGLALMTTSLLLSVKMGNDPIFAFIAGTVTAPIFLATIEMLREFKSYLRGPRH